MAKRKNTARHRAVARGSASTASSVDIAEDVVKREDIHRRRCYGDGKGFAPRTAGGPMLAVTPTLYVCHGDDGGPRRHPCRRVQEALRAAARRNDHQALSRHLGLDLPAELILAVPARRPNAPPRRPHRLATTGRQPLRAGSPRQWERAASARYASSASVLSNTADHCSWTLARRSVVGVRPVSVRSTR
jgi:hypothetical protein